MGQRSGLKIGGRAGAAAAPWYVADKIPMRNALVVVQTPDHPLLLSSAFTVEEMHWIDPAEAATQPFECMVKTRYRQADLRCKLRLDGDAVWRAALDRPAAAVTPGQYAVFYQGERCLGGGIIAQRFSSAPAAAAQRITYNSVFSLEGS